MALSNDMSCQVLLSEQRGRLRKLKLPHGLVADALLDMSSRYRAVCVCVRAARQE